MQSHQALHRSACCRAQLVAVHEPPVNLLQAHTCPKAGKTGGGVPAVAAGRENAGAEEPSGGSVKAAGAELLGKLAAELPGC